MKYVRPKKTESQLPTSLGMVMLFSKNKSVVSCAVHHTFATETLFINSGSMTVTVNIQMEF
jgi:mannose-6-phosphate isomerase-like protein (cupin superfamily)